MPVYVWRNFIVIGKGPREIGQVLEAGGLRDLFDAFVGSGNKVRRFYHALLS